MTVPTARPPISAADVRAHTIAAWPLPGRGDTWHRWDLLAALASTDLPLVKIVEPHHDAVAILAELGGPSPGPDDIWAVWAAEPPFAVLTGVLRAGAWELVGTKAFCSGATIATHALVTAETPGGPRLFAVRLDADGIAVGDGRDWRGQGMRRADTRTLTFAHVRAEPVGEAGDYVDRVGFWAGGIGIAACWLGGARGVAATLERSSGRLDPHGLAHLGAVRSDLDVAALALRAAASRLDDGAPAVIGTERLAHALRSHLADVADRTVTHVGRALGPGPLVFDGLHAEHVADLQVFVRQHHAERDLERLGSLEQVEGEGYDDA